MRNVLFIHALGLTPYALKEPLPLTGSKGKPVTAFQYLLQKPPFPTSFEQVVVLTDLPREELLPLVEPYMDRELFSIHSQSSWSAAELLRTMQSVVEKDGPDNSPVGSPADLFLVWGDAPLLDTGLLEKMHSNHRRYFADYTFADGYPRGLAPEILKASALPQLIELAERHSVPAGRDFIFEVVQKDINAFDLETEVAPTDQRLLRVSLTADTRRNFYQLKAIIAAGGSTAESVQRVIDEQPELLRTLPAYVNVQITDGCPQACSYCAFPQMGGDVLNRRGEMSLEHWTEVVDKVENLCGDATIGVSLWGEPSLHTRFVDIVTVVLERPSLSLVIETSGVGWSLATLQELGRQFGQGAAAGGVPVGNRLTWIVSLDAHEPQMYNRLRGPQWEEAQASIELLSRLFPDLVYVQAVRMRENEEQLDQFYRYWKQQEHVTPIVQKYDSFCGALPERKVTDLSPIKRFPCWHLKRDLSILIDGSVPMCREDLQHKHPLGNIFEEDIETIWARGNGYYRRHLEADYPELCRSCDEYYTYNF